MQRVGNNSGTNGEILNGDMSRKESRKDVRSTSQANMSTSRTLVTPSVSTTSSRLRKKKMGKLTDQKNTWGRASKTDFKTLMGCLFILLVCPILPGFFILACSKHKGSLQETLLDPKTPMDFIALFTSYNWDVVGVYAAWFLFQIIMFLLPDVFHHLLPSYRGGIQQGAMSPAGIVLSYNINGLQAWFMTHFFWFMNIYYFNLFSPTYIAKNVGTFFPVANMIGYGLSFFAFLKAHMFPSNAADCKYSGSFIYDFLMGVEFNPRIGNYFDFKLFCNGRPGIVAWTIINMSFALYQKEKHGQISDSMYLVNFLQAIYVLDFFWNETWYLKTIDIAHDHFGWYLGWGDIVWLPFMYTLQAYYLVDNPVELGPSRFTGFLLLGLLGYYIFRSSNSQKDQFRADPEQYKINGQKASSITASYEAIDGKTYKSRLLTDGWWGYARHMNYTGDLLGSLAYCLCCGYTHILPYFYIIYMFILLVHRIYRDEHRCQAKYGEYWKQYCTTVPYRLIPRIF